MLWAKERGGVFAGRLWACPNPTPSFLNDFVHDAMIAGIRRLRGLHVHV